MPAKAKPPPACGCAERVNALLKPQGQELNLSLRMVDGEFVARAVVETVRTFAAPRRRKPPPRLIASFCPFCGVIYPDLLSHEPAKKRPRGGKEKRHG